MEGGSARGRSFRDPGWQDPQPEDMTGAALFLASDDAHHITGSYMIADGGYSMLGA
jgi:3-oxoacyl-[acyl-carrier protein] reductase